MAVTMRALDATMRSLTTRRQILVGTASALATSCAPSPGPRASTPVAAVTTEDAPELHAIESRIGGRVGVFALDTASARTIAHRADERFAMCSTFKWLLAAAVLAKVDRGELALSARVPFGAADLLEYAPITRARVAEGELSVDALAEAAVTVSDNTAANLLLAKIDGPAGLTRFARATGDRVTRLDRDEPTLNDHRPDDPRDTTSPRAMVETMRVVLTGDVLAPASRERLLGWMRACTTGKERLRRGFPATWSAGDKTGSGPRGAVNDLAIAWPPGRAPVVIAAYLSESPLDGAALAAAHVDIAHVVVGALFR